MYAIALSGGKQFKVEQNSVIRVPSLDLPVGEKLRLEQILLFNHDDRVEVGNPYIEGAYAEARVVQHGRQKKINIVKYKRRKDYRRKLGHRQGYTELVIDSIVPGSGKKAVPEKVEKELKKPAESGTKPEKKPAAKPKAVKKEAEIPVGGDQAAAPKAEKKKAEPNDPHIKEAYLAEGKKEYTTPTPTVISPTPIPNRPIAPISVPNLSSIEHQPSTKKELLTIDGIDKKTESHLEKLGINNIDDLAKASAENISKELKINLSSVQKWISIAKKLQ